MERVRSSKEKEFKMNYVCWNLRQLSGERKVAEKKQGLCQSVAILSNLGLENNNNAQQRIKKTGSVQLLSPLITLFLCTKIFSRKLFWVYPHSFYSALIFSLFFFNWFLFVLGLFC
jgi:hypothetical protein